MAHESRESLYRRAIAHYGADHQKMKAVEEMAELTKALCDIEQGRCSVSDLAGEIADILITVGQLVQIYDCRNEVQRQMKEKLIRLQKRMKGENEP